MVSSPPDLTKIGLGCFLNSQCATTFDVASDRFQARQAAARTPRPDERPDGSFVRGGWIEGSCFYSGDILLLANNLFRSFNFGFELTFIVGHGRRPEIPGVRIVPAQNFRPGDLSVCHGNIERLNPASEEGRKLCMAGLS
jgi:hypothetical protein